MSISPFSLLFPVHPYSFEQPFSFHSFILCRFVPWHNGDWNKRRLFVKKGRSTAFSATKKDPFLQVFVMILSGLMGCYGIIKGQEVFGGGYLFEGVVPMEIGAQTVERRRLLWK
jgi:hypothetical protein